MPSQIVDVLAAAAMHVKYDSPTGEADIPFDISNKIMSIRMMVPSGTIDEFSLVNTGAAWLLANEHTLVCPRTFTGLLARVAFHYTRNLVISYEFSDFSSVLDVEFNVETNWSAVIAKILAVQDVGDFLSKHTAADNTRLPRITADGVTDELVQKVRSAVAVWSQAVPLAPPNFPLAGLPYVLQELQTSEKSAEGVFPFDPSAAQRLLLSLGPAANSKAEIQKMVRIATDYHDRTSSAKGTGLELTNLQKTQIGFFLKLVRAYSLLPNKVANTTEIVNAKNEAAKAIQEAGAVAEETVTIITNNLQALFGI